MTLLIFEVIYNGGIAQWWTISSPPGSSKSFNESIATHAYFIKCWPSTADQQAAAPEEWPTQMLKNDFFAFKCLKLTFLLSSSQRRECRQGFGVNTSEVIDTRATILHCCTLHFKVIGKVVWGGNKFLLLDIVNLVWFGSTDCLSPRTAKSSALAWMCLDSIISTQNCYL